MRVLSVGKSRTAPILLTAIPEEGEARQYRLTEGEYFELGSPAAGDALTDTAAERLLEYDMRHRARAAAARILAFGENNRAMLLRKLRARGFSPALSDAVADEMVMRGYIREGDQLERAVMAAAKKLWGPRRIKDALAAKGFSREDVRVCLDRLIREGEIDLQKNRHALLLRRLPSDAPAAKRRALLYRYGYGTGEE